MKRLMAVMVALALLCPLTPGTAAEEGSDEKAPQLKLETENQKVSYALAVDIGTKLKQRGLMLDMKAFIRGIEDAQKDREPLLTPEEAAQTMKAFFNKMETERQAEMKAQGDKSKAEGAAFLAANGKKAGVVTTASGLQYTVLKKGDGPKPQPDQLVVIHYRGTLLDGKEFDSSYKRGEPAEFPVGRVVRGFSEGLQLMPMGSKFQLFIPSDLAYGPQGKSPDIAPHTVLTFEVELLQIKNGPPANTPMFRGAPPKSGDN